MFVVGLQLHENIKKGEKNIECFSRSGTCSQKGAVNHYKKFKGLPCSVIEKNNVLLLP